jgi:hypothetical protein
MNLRGKRDIYDFGGDLLTIKEFKECVDSGCFIDYDGFGLPATTKYAWSMPIIRPSSVEEDFLKDCEKHGVTHICWFNK